MTDQPFAKWGHSYLVVRHSRTVLFETLKNRIQVRPSLFDGDAGLQPPKDIIENACSRAFQLPLRVDCERRPHVHLATQPTLRQEPESGRRDTNDDRTFPAEH